MGISLLAPLFLAGLAAVAVPILVHLTARDRRDVERFPSLRFLTRLPFRQVRRQKIRHPLLFALRALAVVLLAVAFARPFVEGASAREGLAAAGGDAVIAFDLSYSMAYGDAWERAVRAARDAVDDLPPGARAALVTFHEDAAVEVPLTADRGAVARALGSLAPGARGTRLAPALRLAGEVLLDAPSAGGGREVVLISDFQARAWDRSDRTRLPAGVRLRAVDVSSDDPENVLVAGVEVRRGDGGGVFAVRLANRGRAEVRGLPVAVESNGARVAHGEADLPSSGGAAVGVGPVPAVQGPTRVTVRAGADQLAPDDAFHLVLQPSPGVPVLLVEADDARDGASLYLREALAVASEPAYRLSSERIGRLERTDIEAAAVVILHDTPVPGGGALRALADHVASGGGLWTVLGRRSASWPEDAAALLPGGFRDVVDRLDVAGVSLASFDDDHPVFEVFAGPRGGSVTAPRFYRYRPIVLADADDTVAALARYTDGAVAMAVRRYGEGRVLLSGSPFDNRWNNLPVQPAFPPLVHEACRFLSGATSSGGFRTVGDVLDLREVFAAAGAETEGEATVETPSGARLEITMEGEPFVPLSEAGFYEVAVPSEPAPYPVAVNVDRAESDLARLDVEAFVAASTAASDPSSPSAAAGGTRLTREERERRQGIWRYLVIGALLLLCAESLLSNRIARA